MAASSVAEASNFAKASMDGMEDRPVPLRGSRHLVPGGSALR
jgi:hypothetical protein